MRLKQDPMNAAEAAARVRKFVRSRGDYYARRPMPRDGVRLNPDSIHAEYGRLDMADLLALCDAVTDAREPRHAEA